jgi:hypothetical protein
MRPTNNRSTSVSLVLWAAICLSSAVAAAQANAQSLHWSKRLSSDERNCLDDLIKASDLTDAGTEQFHSLTAASRVSRADLDGERGKAYIYLFDDIGWCGSAGCALLIGERRAQGTCLLLYSGSGWYTATVLARRDHGYRRLYLPCEARFDGRQYQQLHPACPTGDVQR